MKQEKVKQKDAYTLIEALLYILILGIIGGAVMSGIMLVFRNRTIIEDRITVNEDMRLLIKTIQDDMYFGDGITVNSGTLQIANAVDGNTQVSYYLDGDQVMRMVEGEAPVAVTSLATDVRTFQLEDITTPSTSGTIRITLELANYPRGPAKPETVENITTTISLKFT